jgi:preprotein translocase subunit SecB
MAEEEQNGTGETAAPQGQNGQGGQENDQQFILQRVFLKDLSFESPSAPGIFRKEYQPSVNVDLRTRSTAIDSENYEVNLTITVTATVAEETAFLVEVQQAGVFLIRGLEGENLRRVLGIFCPNMLFPYAREVIDNTLVKGTFPALMMAQVNFEGLYLQALQKAQEQAAAAGTEAPAAGGEATPD